ncbi:tRNA (adenosine(37)-N6)-dimethylallyltransferase MiaA [Agreia sp. COWG]|uniref:tRNA (adenosine(37)-N6)-dimethylallyltransferase MiaA n=1 Tax=Agreia sp. COWG TaxID=2773266 RepID=UPI001AF14879|nr:tRNA (adenosine(37)-N6)-dimethylallyltransferase MiaA [Agreia sp. COWG]CAD5996802.1 tRNA dimethylallyltransferase [Agreia sp. COWG]
MSASPSAGAPIAEVIAIVGATGTGKSELALDLASGLHEHGLVAEVVNADAMQLYAGMDIGTAKLPLQDRRGVPHHLLDVLSVTEDSSVADYQARARASIDDILARGHVPLLVGGSGLYVSSVLFDFQFPGTDEVIRARLEAELVADGPGTLYRRLKQLDEAAAASIGPSNGRRLVRALEVLEMTGKPVSGTLPGVAPSWRTAGIISLGMPRAELVRRLDERVRSMWSAGLVDEAEELSAVGLDPTTTAGKAIGYAQALGQLSGAMTEAGAVEQTQAFTRRYARRQVGWFRRYDASIELDAREPDAAARATRKVLGLSDGD